MIVVVNSTIYGGSGGSVGTYSLAGGATEIAIHEMGHTAYGLADEYPYYAGGNETGHDHHPRRGAVEPNITVNTNRATLKWGWAVAPTTAAADDDATPTARRSDSGRAPCPPAPSACSRGRGYFHCGVYRPEYDCKMRELGVPFCRVCRQVIWNRHRAAGRPAGPRPARRSAWWRASPNTSTCSPSASDGRIMSGLVGRRAAAGPAGSRCPGGVRLRRAGTGRPSRRSPGTPGTSTCSPWAPTTGCGAAWWDRVRRLVGVVPRSAPWSPGPDRRSTS